VLNGCKNQTGSGTLKPDIGLTAIAFPGPSWSTGGSAAVICRIVSSLASSKLVSIPIFYLKS
jgi:hypothetical protein